MRTKEELEQILEGKVEGETVMQLGFKKEFEKEFSAKFDYSYLEKGMESFLQNRIYAFIKAKFDRLPNADIIGLMDLMSKPDEKKRTKKA